MTCEHCGIHYNDFKTGFTFTDIANFLWVHDEDSTKWGNRTRHTVLGHWRQIKLEMWDKHVDNCGVPF